MDVRASTPEALPKEFRVCGRYIFGTVPKCELATSEVLSNFVSAFSKIERAVVAREAHANETDHHLHVFLSAASGKQVSIRSLDHVNRICGGHQGDWQLARNPFDCLKYVMKDGDYSVFPKELDAADWLKSLEKHPGKDRGVFSVIAKEILEGVSIEELIHDHPGFMLQHSKKAEAFQDLCDKMAADEAHFEPYHGVVRYSGMGHSTGIVTEWIREHFGQCMVNGVQRPLKSKNLWLVGPTDVGKTHLWSEVLSKFGPIFLPSYQTTFQDDWKDGKFNLIVLDEFNGADMTCHVLNRLADGQRMTFNRKTRGPTYKKDNVPVLICSNRSPRQVFPNIAKEDPLTMDALINRFVVVEIHADERLDVRFQVPIDIDADSDAGSDVEDTLDLDDFASLSDLEVVDTGLKPAEFPITRVSAMKRSHAMMEEELLDMIGRSPNATMHRSTIEEMSAAGRSVLEATERQAELPSVVEQHKIVGEMGNHMAGRESLR